MKRAGRIRSSIGSASMPTMATTTPNRSSARGPRPEMAATQVLMDAALAAAAASRDQDLADLVEELRIPSISTFPHSRDDCLRNARWLQERLERLGMKTEVADVIDGGLPVVMGEWNERPGKPHLTIYGHYDGQPPDPLDQRATPPFEPAVRDGRLYARGCADKKGNHLATVKAVETQFATRRPPIHIHL